VLVIAISQSGESTDTNLVLERARDQGARTIGITNEGLEHHGAHLPSIVFLVHAGRERRVAATKTYTGQLLLLYLVAYALGAGIELDDLARFPEWTGPGADARTRHRAPRRALSLHGARPGAGPRPELRERVRVCAEADGDLLRGGRAIFERRFAAWPHRDAGRVVPRRSVRARRASPGLARAR
jgi:hypothetical protein